MKKVKVEDIINPHYIKPGNLIYTAGNAATPQVLLGQLGRDLSIKGVQLLGILLLGNKIDHLFSEERCRNLIHRIIFNSHLTREAVNHGRAKYHPIHLSEVPKHIRTFRQPDIALISVAGPDQGGNYSLGTTVEGVLAAITTARERKGLVIAEKNGQMPFILGSTIPEKYIDFMVETDYPLPVSPVQEPDETARRIGEIIAARYIQDGSGKEPGSTLQYGIGEVPEAVTEAIIRKGVRDLGIHTELLADGMARLIRKGIVTNKWKSSINFSVSSIFLSSSQMGYDWMHYNSSIQSRPSDYTNSVFRIAEHPRMVTVNSAIGVDLHGNIWADSLQARQIYSGVGGQSDFIRGAQYSKDGVAIIALKSTTSKGISKIMDRCPAGITTTAIAADQVIIVTEYGAFDPRGLSLGERAVGIAHLARPDYCEELLRIIAEDPAYHRPKLGVLDRIPGFIPYEKTAQVFGL